MTCRRWSRSIPISSKASVSNSGQGRATRERRTAALGILLFAIALAALWEALGRAGLVAAYLLPPLSAVVGALGGLVKDSEILIAFADSGFAIALAFLLAAPVAVSMGVLLGQLHDRARRLSAAMNLMLGVPQSIFLPIFVLLFGVGLLEKVVFGFTHAFFVVTVVTAAAVRSVPLPLVKAARAFGADERQIVRHIYLPAMTPLILTGLRIGLIFTVIGVLVAEMYASRTGIGRYLLLWGEELEMTRLLAAVLVISAITIAVNEALRRFERRAWVQESTAWSL